MKRIRGEKRKGSAADCTTNAITKHKRASLWRCIAGLLAVVVLFSSTYTMILPALTMEQTAYCGQEDHTHSDECYEERLICQPEGGHEHGDKCYAEETSLVCGKEESEGHTHTDACSTEETTLTCDREESEGHSHSEECYDEDGSCVCGQEESEGHAHSDDCYSVSKTMNCGKEETAGHTHDSTCYQTEKKLICTTPESNSSHEHTESCYERVLVCEKEEHTHELSCFSNPDADVETKLVWERTLNDVTLTGIWADDLVAVAESQIGYGESKNNYAVDENGDIKGYTRYGAWYGDEYGDWCAMFVSFCLNYAEISDKEMPYEASCARWIEALAKLDKYGSADSYTPKKGDLIFFRSEADEKVSDHTGIVGEVLTDSNENPVKLRVIEGNSDDTVAKRTYELKDSRIMGYGILPENPELPEEPALAAEEPEAPNLAEIDLAALTTEELNALLEQITPEDLQTYLGELSDEEYDALMERMSEEAAAILAAFLESSVALLATGDAYVGYSKAASTGTVEFANGGGGGGVRKYYLAPKSIYNQYYNYSAYNLQQKLLAQSEVAYCFNFHSATPYSVYESKNYSTRPFTFYNERENASASLFYSNTTYPRSGYSQNALYQKILTVAMNGYPNDYSGIWSKYRLTADEFRFITQYAVWYYTDSISLRFRTSNGQPQFCVNNDKTGECLTVHSTTYHGYYNANSSNIRAAYEELIGSSLDTATVNTSHINLYKPQNGSSQNLLTVGQEDAPPPQQEPNRLKLTKNVSGTAADPEQEFTFTIQLRNSSFSSVSGSYTVIPEAISGVTKPNITSIRFQNGTATVKLKHGQSITIDGLPDNFYYTILETEADQNGYTTTVTEGQNSNMQSGDGGLGTVPVTFNNHKDAPPTITKIQIPAKKMIDNGQTPIGENRFRFKLTGNGEEIYADSDENGNILFPEIIYRQPGTYTYTIEEVTDERDGVSFDFDKSKKTVTVTINSQAVQTFDPDAVYYAFEELSYDDFEYYYYVDTVPGGRGIVMYCTYQGVSGPQYDLTKHPVKDQTYKVVLNPTVSQITSNRWVMSNIYGDDLANNLRKLFYYLETDDAKNISNGDKQSLVWSATGKTSSISSISVNGKASSSNVTTVLNNIYETVSPPSSYNLAFFIPTGTQKNDHPQPLATGYGAQIDETIDEVAFNNTSKEQNSLKLTKTVTGTAGETDREFNFTIQLRSSDWKTLSGTYTVTPDAISGVEKPGITDITFTDGTASVKLKHGQSITVEGLPSGFYYTIQEAEWNLDSYTSSVTKGTSGNMSSGNGATGAVEVEFTNHKDAPPPPPSTSYEAVIEATKTLDGEAPADGQFTFILRDADGNEVGRQTNDVNGKITFHVTLPAPGTYTYTIEEFNDGQEGIIYDTEVKTVTVTVSASQLQEIVDGSSFVGSGTTGNFKITVNGNKQLDVYCINGAVGNPSGTYDKVFNPTTSDLAGHVTANNYGNALPENLRKLLYYFDTHDYTDKIGYTELTKGYRQELIWCLTGNPGEQHWTYTDNLKKILAASNPPDSYTVVMFAPKDKGQPVAAGYLPKAEVTYSAKSGTAEFKNIHSYSLPETGGVGTTQYTMGGLLLMSGAALLLYKTGLARKKEGER